MARKYELISELYDRTCSTASANPESWMAFLRSACNNYKLRFDEQLLVFAQRPDATAVLEIERWNRVFGRWVNRGARGIAVFEDADRSSQRLNHYFDISDTHPGEFSKPVPIWEFKGEYSQEVIDTLESTFGELDDSSDLTYAVISAARNAVEDNLTDYIDDLIADIPDSFLEGLDEQAISAIYKNVVTNSVAYMIMERLGIATDEIGVDDFRDVVNFNTKSTVTALGLATSDIAEMGLTEISKTVMALDKQNRIIAEKSNTDYNVDKENKNERSFHNDRNNQLHKTGRLPASKSDSTRTATGDFGQIRTDEEEVSQGASQSTLLQSADTVQNDRAFGRDTAESHRDGRSSDDTNGSSRGLDRGAESTGYDDLGAENEQPEKQSAGDSNSGSNIQLEWYDRHHEDKSLPFLGNDDTINSILITTPHLKATKSEIKDFFETHLDIDERTEYIKSIFNNDYTEVTLTDGRIAGYKTMQNVLHLWEGSYDNRTKQSYYDWSVVARHFEAMRLLGMLTDKAKPLPSVEGQFNILQEAGEEKTFVTDLRKDGIHFLGYVIKAERKQKTPDPKTWSENLVGKPYPDMKRLTKKIHQIQDEIRAIEKFNKLNLRAAQIQLINSKIMGIAQYLQPSICSYAFNAIDRRINNTALAVWKRMYPTEYNKMQVPMKMLSNLPHRHEGYDSKTFAIQIEGKWFGITYSFITHSKYETKPFNQKMTPYTAEGRKIYVNYRNKYKPLPCDRPSINTPEDIALSIYAKDKGWKANFEYFMNREYAYNRDKGEEHGSAKWGEARKINKKYCQSPQSDNKLMTQNVRIGLNAKKHRRNLNTLVCGGSGAGKTRFYCKPNLMQANTSFVILDPKGEILRDTGHLLEKKGYEVKVLDLISMEKSHCYNPFVYLENDNDIQKLVTNLFKSTTPKGSQSQDPFWDTSASMLLLALIFYLHYEAPEDEQNFEMVMEMLRAGAIGNEDDNIPTPLDQLFLELQEENPEHIALKYYHNYHSGAAKTLQSIQITLAARLEKFNLESLASLTITDELDLRSLGEKKTALFALIPDNDTSFNFLVSILYTQLFQQLFFAADHIHGGALPVPVHFLMDEFANVSLPDDFDKILSVMRSRGVSVSIILQNLAQLKTLFEKQWESIVGNCDEFLYLGGNEQSTHKYVSELLGKETIDTNTYGKSTGRSGNYSTNYQISGRELLTPDEVRLLDNKYAILFIRGEQPVMDLKYDILKHPNVALTTDGKEKPYLHGTSNMDSVGIEVLDINLNEVPETEYKETTYELLSDEDFEDEENYI